MAERVTKENYDELRQKIVSENENLVGIILRDDEKALDEKLSLFKKEYRDACGGDVPYGMPVLSDRRITDSRLYGLMKRLPKGADLHVHGTALVPVWKLIGFLRGRDDILIDTDTLVLRLPGDEGSEGCPTVREALECGAVTEERLETAWTVLGGKGEKNIWNYFEHLFDYTEALDRDMDILYDYYLFALRDYLANGIFHIEIHILLLSDPRKTAEILETVRKAYYKVKSEDGRLSVSVVGASMKQFDSIEDTKAILENALRAREMVRDDFDPSEEHDFVIGFDLINEEDASRPLREYAPMLLDFKEEHPDFRYYLHCGESLSPESDNLVDAYLISADRVGHGMNLYRYPRLLKMYADREICLECCPISNQTLRYTEDIRLHPGAEYLRRGLAVALCSDDPVFQEHEALVDDFFAATVSWNLTVADIKQLCMNSITYSGLDGASRRRMLKTWSGCWNDFVRKELEEG